MRLPIILALAVVLLTPANIRELVQDAAGDAQLAVAKFLKSDPVQVAEAEVSTNRLDTSANSIGSIR